MVVRSYRHVVLLVAATRWSHYRFTVALLSLGQLLPAYLLVAARNLIHFHAVFLLLNWPLEMIIGLIPQFVI